MKLKSLRNKLYRKIPKLPDRNNLSYKEWREAVSKRDGYKCKNCGSGYKCEAHHIIKYADSVSLRYVLSNGILLCRNCHNEIWGKEELYIEKFKRLIRE